MFDLRKGFMLNLVLCRIKCFLEWFNPFQNQPWFLCVCSLSLLKTLQEKEKLLVTSNFSFSRSVFYPFGELSVIFIKYKIVVCKLLHFGRVKNWLLGKGLKFNSSGWFYTIFFILKARIGSNYFFNHFYSHSTNPDETSLSHNYDILNGWLLWRLNEL